MDRVDNRQVINYVDLRGLTIERAACDNDLQIILFEGEEEEVLTRSERWRLYQRLKQEFETDSTEYLGWVHE